MFFFFFSDVCVFKKKKKNIISLAANNIFIFRKIKINRTKVPEEEENNKQTKNAPK
jgi:ribosomal protein S3AE